MLSRVTPWAVLVVGLAAILLLWAAIASGVGGEDVSVAISDIGSVAIVSLAAALIFAVASTYGSGEAVRTTWFLVGAGAVAYALGDLTWTVFEVILRQEPSYPGLPDLFYVLEYPLLATAVLRAGYAYRGLVDLRRSAAAGLLASLGALLVLWFGFLSPIVADSEIAVAEKAISVFYPTGDVVLLLGPTVFALAVMSRLAGGAFARPWWWVGIGVVVLAMSDTTYSWLEAADAYASGAFVDYGWMLAHVLVAAGAVAQYRLSTPRATRRAG